MNNFTFATLDGTISNWNAGMKPAPGGTQCFECHVATSTIKINNSAKRASYFGLTIATNTTTGAPTYYATNFTSGKVEAYDASTFKPVRLTGRYSAGNSIKIPGLWGVSFGNGNRKAGPVNTLCYAAGGDDYLTGVFGQITAN